MPAFQIRERLIPYRILAYLLYAHTDELEWLECVSEDEVRLITGPGSRALRMKISKLWDALHWLEDQKLVEFVKKEKKRGSVVIKLKPPTNVN